MLTVAVGAVKSRLGWGAGRIIRAYAFTFDPAGRKVAVGGAAMELPLSGI